MTVERKVVRKRNTSTVSQLQHHWCIFGHVIFYHVIILLRCLLSLVVGPHLFVLIQLFVSFVDLSVFILYFHDLSIA